MAKGLSPTQRTIRELRKRGCKCAVVEKWNSFAARPGGGGHPGIRQDLFGIIDILALDPIRGVVGIQCCGKDFAGHLDKLIVTNAQDTLDWLETPGTALELWGWRKLKVQRGGKAETWQPRVEEIVLKGGAILPASSVCARASCQIDD